MIATGCLFGVVVALDRKTPNQWPALALFLTTFGGMAVLSGVIISLEKLRLRSLRDTLIVAEDQIVAVRPSGEHVLLRPERCLKLGRLYGQVEIWQTREGAYFLDRRLLYDAGRVTEDLAT